MASRYHLDALNARIPDGAANGGARTKKVLNKYYLAMADTAVGGTINEHAFWDIKVPVGLVTPLTLVIDFLMLSATSGNIVFYVYVEAISDTDPINLLTTTSFATVNASAATAVPSSAGYPTSVSVSLTNDDAAVAADRLRIWIARGATDAGDTATGDLYFDRADLRDAA